MKVPRAGGRSIVHDFKRLSKPLSPGELEQAVWDYDVDKLIKGHMRLTLQVAAIYKTNKQEDIIGVAMYALVWAVNRWPKVKINSNITPYIVVTVHSKIRDYLNRDHPVKIPKTSQLRRKHVVIRVII